jgi:Xaa-Pro aminopeptidase
MPLEKARRIMKREEIRGILLFDPFNIRYLTGYKPLTAYSASAAVIGEKGDPWVIVPDAEAELARAKSWFRNVQPYSMKAEEGKTSGLLDRIREAVEALGLASAVMGLELNYVSARRFEELKRGFPEAGFKDASLAMADLRMVKDEAEIERMTAAVQIAESGVRTAIEFIQPGITEIEVAGEVERTLRKAGATQTGYPTVIASGPRAGYPYSPASRREIEAGEFVVIAVSAVYDEYCSDLTRTVITGKPDDAKQQLFSCALKSIRLAEDQLKPGIRASDIAITMRKAAENGGFTNAVPDVVGHSIGLQPWEPPILTATNETPIVPGMILCIESGIFQATLGGVRLGDTVLHQRDGSYTFLNQITLDTV